MSDIDDQSEQIREGRGAQSGGRIVQVRDGRVSRAVNWVLAAIGTVLVGLSGTAVATLISVKEDVSVMKSMMSMDHDTVMIRLNRTDQTTDALQDHVNSLDSRVSRLEGPMRGGRGH